MWANKNCFIIIAIFSITIRIAFLPNIMLPLEGRVGKRKYEWLKLVKGKTEYLYYLWSVTFVCIWSYDDFNLIQIHFVDNLHVWSTVAEHFVPTPFDAFGDLAFSLHLFLPNEGRFPTSVTTSDIKDFSYYLVQIYCDKMGLFHSDKMLVINCSSPTDQDLFWSDRGS